MNGMIKVNEFDLLLKKNEALLEATIQSLKKIQNSCLNLTSKFNSKDLNFIDDKFSIQLGQFKKIENKLNGYQKSLKSVFEGYCEQGSQFLLESQKLIS